MSGKLGMLARRLSNSSCTIFCSASVVEIVCLSSATLAARLLAASSSLFDFAIRIASDAVRLSACAPSLTRIIARRRPSIERIFCEENSLNSRSLRFRRFNALSKASGFSRMKRISCMTFSTASCPALGRASTSSCADQDVDGRDTNRKDGAPRLVPGHDESISRTIRLRHSAGLEAAAAAAAARSAASRFSTMRTDQIEPSNSATSGSASDIWLKTSGGVSTAAMTKAPTMK